MNTHNIILRLSFTLITGFLAVCSQFAYGVTPPNLVIFVADDLGWGDVGYHISYPGTVIKTPNIDQLATDGVELNRFYAWPTCSPTRTALMSGRSPIRSGITSPTDVVNTGPPLDEHFLPQSFQSAGYQTWLCGKWHMSDEYYHPNLRGFDHFYGHLSGGVDYYTHKEGQNLDWQRNGVTVDQDGEYTTYLLADEAVSLIENRDINSPFFLYVPFNAPHTPLQAPPDLPVTSPNRAVFAAMVEGMDNAIGQVLDSIDSEGLTNNTLVLFFSDNGAQRNTTSTAGRNSPLTGWKGGLNEGGIRTPAVIKWPDELTTSYKCEQFISVMDLLPTITSAMGVTPKNYKTLDGVNRWDQIRGVSPNVTPQEVVYILNSNAAVFDGQWKLLRSDDGDKLYDIANDETESTDMAGANPAVVQNLSAMITTWNTILNSTEVADLDNLQDFSNQWLQSSTTTLLADYDFNGTVDFNDYVKLSQSWLTRFGCP